MKNGNKLYESSAESRMRQDAPRKAQSEETRQRLLDVSLDLFVRRGYAGTSVRDIAAAAGVSPGLMFHYFASKEAVLDAHARFIAWGIENLATTLGTADAPLATFTGIATMLLASFAEPAAKNRFLLANQILSLESIPPAVRGRVSSTRSIAASVPLIERGQALGEIRAGSAQVLAVAYWGALQGIAEVLAWNPDAPIPSAADVVVLLKA
jgi:AcrR family transcriptional regulator